MENKPETTGEKWDGRFQKGDDPRRNMNGRPKGSVSVITRLKQIFEENPDDFEDFIKRYKDNPSNEKHVVEMLDGKPRQNIGLDGGEDGKPITSKVEVVFKDYEEPEDDNEVVSQ